MVAKETLARLYELLTEWISDPQWNTASPEWANAVETRRQVAIDILQIDPEWEEP